jgi:hypothetical protein
MLRGTHFILLSLVAASGLSYLALRSTESGSGATGPPEPVTLSQGATPGGGAVEAESEAHAMELRDPRGAEGAVGVWELIPVNERGQPLPQAKVTARSGDEVQTGTGRVRWTGLTPGLWEVTVEADGLPTWRGPVTLEPNTPHHRTPVRLGDGFFVKGTVRDTEGRSVARTPIAFESSPGAGDQRIVGRTDSKGHFSVELPTAGNYRFSAGPPEDARWIETTPGTKLWNGGPAFAEVTVPPACHLLLEFEGDAAKRPSRVELFAFDKDRAARQDAMDAEQAEREADLRRRRNEAELAAKLKLKESLAKDGAQEPPGKPGGPSTRPTPRSRPTVKRNPRGRGRGANSAPTADGLLGNGWHRIYSSPVAEAKLPVEGLPHGEPLRLVVHKDGVRHAATGTITLQKARSHVRTVHFTPSGGQRSAEGTLGAVRTQEAKVADEGVRSPLGIVWR